MNKPYILSGHKRIEEPSLLFANEKTDIHPLRGLINHGPYSKKYGYISNIKIALVAPKGKLPVLHRLINELNSSAKPKEAKEYYPDYPGFEKLFGFPIDVAAQ